MGRKSIGEVGLDDLVRVGLSEEEAEEIGKAIKDVVGDGGRGFGLGPDPRGVWRELVERRVTKPWYPHKLHQLMFYSVYANWDESTHGPPLYWFPSL